MAIDETRTGLVDPEFYPPDMSFLQCTRATMCTVTFPGAGAKPITIHPVNADPRLHLNGASFAAVTLDGDGKGTFELTYNYGMSGQRPDVRIELYALDESNNAIPDSTVTYIIGIRQAGVPIVDSDNDFAIVGRAVDAGGSVMVTYSTWDGMPHLSGGVKLRVSTGRANARFYAADGTDVTQQGPEIAFAEYTTIPAASGLLSLIGKIVGRAAMQNVGIAQVNVTVPLSDADVPFQIVTVHPHICTGELPSLITSFGSTLNLAGGATTHVSLREIPPTIRQDATVVLLVNGRPVGPYDLTMGDLVAMGYDLPKIAFTHKTIDDQIPGNEALLSHLVQSDSSNLNEILGTGVRFKTKNIEKISNMPDSTITFRPLPPPLIQPNVVNVSVVLGGILKVSIDFPAGFSTGLQGCLFLYANGYEKNSNQVDKHTLTSATFTTAPGMVEIDVPTSALFNFAISPDGNSSNLWIDYYVIDPAVYRTLKENAGPEGIDEALLDSAKQYSQYVHSGWPLVTTI